MGISPRRSSRSQAAPQASNTSSANPSPPSPRKRRNSLQSHNQSPPPALQTSSPAPEDEDEEDDASQEITRCVCGSQEYPFPDADVEDTGFMICCERCNVWQHGPCVGVMSENEAPDVYYCEECRPDLHELGNRNQGLRQSRWIGGTNPNQPTRRKKSSQQPTSTKTESLSPTPSDSKDPSSKERKPSPKKRSTMNSRDAAYDYSSLFPHTSTGDEESRLDEGSPSASARGESRRRRAKRVADDEDDEGIQQPGRSKRRRASNDMDVKEDSASDQQQGGSSTPILTDSGISLTKSGNGNGKRPNNNGKRKLGNSTVVKEGRVDSEEPPLTPTLRQQETVVRPARARIPQARSGLNEMRKRVGAILEYVGRLQADMAPTGSETETPTPVDESEPYEKPDMDNASSVVMMQYLTRRCLDFEVKFGKYPGRYG